MIRKSISWMSGHRPLTRVIAVLVVPVGADDPGDMGAVAVAGSSGSSSRSKGSIDDQSSISVP